MASPLSLPVSVWALPPIPSPPRPERAEDRELETLIAGMRVGDEKALGRFYDVTGPLVHGLILRITGDRGDAEEVTGDVYLQAWRQAGRYDRSRGTPTTWLLTLARSRAIDRVRQGATAKRLAAPLGDEILVDDRQSPFQESAAREQRERVGAALEAIPPKQRQAIELAFYAGLSHVEIADQLEEPLGTVKTRIRQGMIKLAQLLREIGPEETE
jgi:RNA polymerase sigma-70 factor (ECF subfamily)